MNDQDKKAFAEYWYEKNMCPGCGADLEKVAGKYIRHWLPGHVVSSNNTTRTTTIGEPAATGMDADDNRLCFWTADDLVSLVHIGSGMVKVKKDD